MKRKFPSKILLFGEYSIIRGSDALCIPYPLFEGVLDFKRNTKDSPDGELKAFSSYLKFLKSSNKLPVPLDLQSFDFDISQGLYFDSTIPRGFGVGSSGALTAAVFDRYSTNISRKHDISVLQKKLSVLEAHFHGSSSGVDPLVSYLGKGLLVSGKKKLSTINIPKFKKNKGAVFLLNTWRQRRTEHLMNLFLEKSQSLEFDKKCKKVLLPITETCIKNFLQSDRERLFKSFRKLSQFQFDNFPSMIPPLFKELWQRGIQSDNYYFKLCGAGGGGFLLGVTKDFNDLDTSLKGHEIRPVIRI